MHHILLVEDNAEDVEAIRRALRPRQESIALNVAPDAETALQAAVRPDLIILDLSLPGDCGNDIIRRFKARPETALTPIVVLSASGDSLDVQECYRLGATGYCVKAIERHIFERRILTICEYWLECVQLPH